jgi:urease accessory protein UreF
MTTTKNTKMTETEALRADLELTRRHLAGTVQELSRQLNVPRRIKESATSAGHRAVQAAGSAGERAKQMPATAREHPKAAAAVGGAVALGVGAAAWIVGRGK